MKKIKHPTVLKVSLEELVSFQLGYILREFSFNKTELLVLSYIYLYKDDATSKLQADKVLGSYQTIKNYMSNLRKTGLIIENRLHPQIKLFTEDLEFTVKLTIDETKRN